LCKKSKHAGLVLLIKNLEMDSVQTCWTSAAACTGKLSSQMSYHVEGSMVYSTQMREPKFYALSKSSQNIFYPSLPQVIHQTTTTRATINQPPQPGQAFNIHYHNIFSSTTTCQNYYHINNQHNLFKHTCLTSSILSTKSNIISIDDVVTCPE
jgi:hypothetical protein